jgi:DNA-binding XRE family transcriptional regulator
VRERRRQRGLPLPIADEVLPFRPHACNEESSTTAGERPTDANEERHTLELRTEVTMARVADAWTQMVAAEQVGSSRQVLNGLEAAYLSELKACYAAQVAN